jgi:glycerol-3-phosphate dehydrogenase
LPGATGIDAARKRLGDMAGLSQHGIERLLGIYGGRASQIAALADDNADLAKTLDSQQSLLAAEVVFALRHEFAISLTDIVHRRLMIGLAADQGAGVCESIAAIAADEAGWTKAERLQQLEQLRQYNARLRPVSSASNAP